MSEAVKVATPIEVLEDELKIILSNTKMDKDTKEQMKKSFARVKEYEQKYYDNHYLVINGMLKDSNKENELLKTTNRALASYINILERGAVYNAD